MLSLNAIRYTLNHLLSVALPTENTLDFAFEVADNWLHITFAEDCRIDMAFSSDEEHGKFLKGTFSPILIESSDKQILVPLFKPQTASGADLNGQYSQRCLTIPYDLVTPSFVLLSREEEYLDLPRDEHNRFLFSFSLTKRYNCIDFPLTDEYALLLRQWIFDYLKPNLNIHPRTHHFIPTHDIDLLHRFKGSFQAFKSIFGRDLLINHSVSETRKSLQEYLAWKNNHFDDPYILAIKELIQLSMQHQLSSVFFFKAQMFPEPDCTYNINEAEAKYAMQQITQAGMKIGLHGSYNSYNQPDRYEREKERLEQVLGATVTIGRQHYLRFHLQRNLYNYLNNPIGTPPQVSHHNTLKTWQLAKIHEDYTLGYAEQPGFRCGTCHPYPLYDLDNDEPTDIIEHPLIVMDGSLFDYLKLDIDESNLLIDRLRRRCIATEGDFVILWHNHMLSRNYRTRFEEVYVRQLNK